MSAFMVGRDHIAYVVTGAQKLALGQFGFSWHWEGQGIRLDSSDRDQAARVGQMLWDENLKSIHARYPDTIEKPDNIPGVIGEVYVYAHSRPYRLDQIDFVQLLKAIHCLKYQFCEHDEWQRSQAYAFLRALEGAAVRSLAGYDDAQWEIEPRPALDKRQSKRGS